MIQRSHSLHIDRDKCTGDMRCMRNCPAQAIRVWNRKASMLENRCIECGECIRVCCRHAITPLTDSFTDLSGFRYTVALPSPSLYSQFGVGVTPGTVHAALRSVGFDEVLDLTWACDRTNRELAGFLEKRRGPRPLIGSFCPAATRLIQLRFPELVSLVIPFESPKELIARKIKKKKAAELEVKEEEIGAIYLTPCPSKMWDVRRPARRERSFVDGAVAISHLYASMMSVLGGLSEEKIEEPVLSGRGLAWAYVGGQASSLEREGTLSAGGVENMVHILEEIENGRLQDVDYVECRACRDGCIGGCLMVENPYRARNKVLTLLQGTDRGPEDGRVAAALPPETKFTTAERLSPTPSRPLGDDVVSAIRKVKRKEQVLAALPGIDCGACGAPTCSAFAEDVVAERAESIWCIFKLNDRLRNVTEELRDLLGDIPGPGGKKGREIP